MVRHVRAAGPVRLWRTGLARLTDHQRQLCQRSGQCSVDDQWVRVPGGIFRGRASDSRRGDHAQGCPGAESTALTDRSGYYRINATLGEVVVTATKDGYNTRESRFDVTDSTVLNFGLAPLLP